MSNLAKIPQHTLAHCPASQPVNKPAGSRFQSGLQTVLGKSSRTAVLIISILTFMLLGAGASVHAGEADVVDVKIALVGEHKYRIDVTVKHDDAGWDHYANRWEVLSLDGELLGTRVLAHPHDNEQPFTRSLVLEIPESHKQVVIRAGDSVHETGGLEMTISLPQP